MFKTLKKYGSQLVLATGSLLGFTSAQAVVDPAILTGITTASDDGVTVASAVAVALVALVAVGWIIRQVRKA